MHARLTPLLRYYMYGLQGLFTEIFYTAIWDFFAASSWKLIGVSSIWAFFIYATSFMFIEFIHKTLIESRVPLFMRALVYMLWTYFWEFSTGFVLSRFGACPWDYEPWFTWNFMGLVTLEYAPLWYFGAIVAEKMTIPIVNSLYFGPGLDFNDPPVTDYFTGKKRK